jgi:hypothetical protein
MSDDKRGRGRPSDRRTGADRNDALEDVFSGVFGTDRNSSAQSRAARDGGTEGHARRSSGFFSERSEDTQPASGTATTGAERTWDEAPDRAASVSRIAVARKVAGAALAAGAKSLAIAALVLGPGFLLLLSGATIPGMIWLFVGSFGLMAWTYRKPWRLGWISALMPPGAAALCYIVQLIVFQTSSPPLIVALVAAGAGVAFGIWRASTHVVRRASDGGVVAERTFGYLLVWALAYGCTQLFSMIAITFLLVRAGLVTGAFTTAMLAVVSIAIFRKGRQLGTSAIVILVIALGGILHPGKAMAQSGACTAVRDNVFSSLEVIALFTPLGLSGPGELAASETRCQWSIPMRAASASAVLRFDQRTASSPAQAQGWIRNAGGQRISGLGDVDGRYSFSNAPSVSRYEMYSSHGAHAFATTFNVSTRPDRYHDYVSDGVIDDLNGAVLAMLPSLHELSHRRFSLTEHARVFAIVSATLIAAGIAVSVAQAIASAIANAVQAGVELTADEIQSAIADALLSRAPARVGEGRGGAPPSGDAPRQPGSWYEAQQNRERAGTRPPRGGAGQSERIRPASGGASEAGGPDTADRGRADQGAHWWERFGRRGTEASGTSERRTPDPETAQDGTDARDRGGGSWYEAHQNRSGSGRRPPPGGAAWSERVRPERQDHGSSAEDGTDEDGLSPEEAARRDEVERRQREKDAARHRRETEENMRDDFERRRRENEAERAAEERARAADEAERARRDAYFEGIQSTLVSQPDNAQYPALLSELDRLQAEGDRDGLQDLWNAVRGERQTQLDRQAERGEVYARRGQGLGMIETGMTYTRDGARVLLVAGTSAASGGAAAGTLGLGEAALAAGAGLGGLGGLDGMKEGHKIIDNEVHWDSEAARRGAARGVRAGMGALVNGVPANGSILLATGKIGFTAASDAAQGYGDEFQKTGDRDAAATRAGRTFGLSLANAAIGEGFNEAERLNTRRGQAAALEEPEWSDYIAQRTQDAKVRINAGKDAASLVGNTVIGVAAEGKSLPQAVQDSIVSEFGGKVGGRVMGNATSIHGDGNAPAGADADQVGRQASVAARLQRERMAASGAGAGLGATAGEAMSGLSGSATSGLEAEAPDLRSTARPDGDRPDQQRPEVPGASDVEGDDGLRSAGNGFDELAGHRAAPGNDEPARPEQDGGRAARVPADEDGDTSAPRDGEAEPEAARSPETTAQSGQDTARQRVIDRLQRERMGQAEPPPITPEYERELARRESGDAEAARGSTMRSGTREDYRHVPGGQGDTQGYTEAAQRYAQMIADKYGVTIVGRPTGHDAPRLIESGEAGPKSEAAKTKTGNPLDVDLGLDPRNIGLSSLFRPELPPQGNRSDAEYAHLRARFEQRLTEWNGRESTVASDSRVRIEGQRVVDAETGQPFAGDLDVFDIRGRHGETLPEAVVQQVMAELRREPEFSQVMHNEQLGWDYSGADNVEVGDDLQTDYERYRSIDGAIRERHRNDEGLVIFAPQSGIGRPTHGEAFYDGPGVEGAERPGEAEDE